VPTEIATLTWERGGRRDLIVDDQVLLAAVLRVPNRGAVLAVTSRNLDVLRRDVLAKTLGAREAPTIVVVLDHRDRPIYSRLPLDRAERIAIAEFREELPQWRVVLYQAPGLSPRHAVRRQVMVFTAAFGVLLAIIVAGIVTTYRLMRRETEMTRLKSDFVANVSHDLKTPLSVIRMFGETLEMRRVTDDTKRQEYYRVITRESERLSRLIDNVLDFSRIEGGLEADADQPVWILTVHAQGYRFATS
jgi:two-component system, OmpR family, phosphate regulon sensor histidine kinase PhoR